MNFIKITKPLKRMMSTSVTKKIDFYYDVISPYSWFAFEVFNRYKKYWDFDLNLHPVLLGGLLNQASNAAPMSIPAKAKYINNDVVQCGLYFDIPIFPLKEPTILLKTGSLAPMRFLTAVKMNYPQYLEEASRAFWMIRWNKDQDFTTPEALKEVCKVCKMSNEESKLTLDEIKSPEVKSALLKSCDNALENNLFGVPTTIIHKGGKTTLVFGSDRFPIIAQVLSEEWKGPNPDKITKL